MNSIKCSPKVCLLWACVIKKYFEIIDSTIYETSAAKADGCRVSIVNIHDVISRCSQSCFVALWAKAGVSFAQRFFYAIAIYHTQ